METAVHLSILKTLSYFHVFRYPLTMHEIWKFLPVTCDHDALMEALDDLKSAGMVFESENYYSLYNAPSLIERRKEGNRLGKKKLRQAMLISRFIGAFPFVEAVCISGSLSKDFALEDSDLDYFIITAPNRLWIARNLLHLFRKLTFLVNAQDLFCMNYFISLGSPGIVPRNFYTAVELATLKTAVSRQGINSFVSENSTWVSEILPNVSLSNNMANGRNRKWVVTRCIEFLVNKLNGDGLDKYFYRSAIRRWAKKWQKLGHDVAACMESVSYHVNTPVNYPVHLPDKIMQEFEAIYTAAEKKYEDGLSTAASTIPEMHYY